MAEGGPNGNTLAAVLAGAAALLTAAGAGIATAFPKIQAAYQARHEARLAHLAAERALLRERVAYAEALGDLDHWGPDHPTWKVHEGARDAWVLADEEIYRAGNSAACALLGFEAGELAGQPWAPRVASGSAEAVRRARDKVMSGRPIERFRLKMIRKQGETIRVVAHSTPGPGAQLVRLELERGRKGGLDA